MKGSFLDHAICFLNGCQGDFAQLPHSGTQPNGAASILKGAGCRVRRRRECGRECGGLERLCPDMAHILPAHILLAKISQIVFSVSKQSGK